MENETTKSDPSSTANNATVEMKGYLHALAPNGKEWRPKYFVVKDNFLQYFADDQAPKPDGVIPLERSKITRAKKASGQGSGFLLEIVSCQKSYVLDAGTEEALVQWIEMLTRGANLTISDLYDITKELGSGTFATVKLGISKKNNQPYAIKIIEKAALKENRESLLTEISILKMVNHQNVICMKEIFETKKKLYLIMDVLDGGELFERIVANGSFSEQKASALTRDIIGAIKYLHELGIVHRDLKPENLLYTDNTDNAQIKIADFGLSKILKNGSMLQTACGTPGYVAPEILEQKGYGKEVDMWSVGVILYILLCGFPPFFAKTDAKMFQMIKRAKYSFRSPYWDDISDSAKDCIDGLLKKDPKERLTAEQALEHPWIKGETAKTTANENMLENLKEFNARGRFRLGVEKLMIVNRLFDHKLGRSSSALIDCPQDEKET